MTLVRWLSYAETATHLPAQVPIWLCPRLSFYTYPDVEPRELNALLRRGRPAPEGRPVETWHVSQGLGQLRR